MSTPEYQVIIVGAGPSGCILGYELARRGIAVLILEKARLPRPKVCAGGITVKAGALIPFDFSQVVEDISYGSRLSYNLVPQKVRTFEKPIAYMVRREKFDYLLASQAVKAGARLLEAAAVRHIEYNDEQVTAFTDSGNYTSSVLVGADGANSVVVKSLGIRSGFEYGLCLNCYIPAKDGQLREWEGLLGLDMGVSGGYAWVFPKKDGFAVGVGSSFREARSLRKYAERVIQAYNLGSVEKTEIKGHLMPVRRHHTHLNYGRILLVGDAAGMIDPLSGEGIHNALKSSYLALPVIEEFLLGKTADMKAYDEAVNREIWPEVKISRSIQKMNSITPRVFFHYLKENDRMWRAFCRLLRGEKTYTSLPKSLFPPLRLLFKII